MNEDLKSMLDGFDRRVILIQGGSAVSGDSLLN